MDGNAALGNAMTERFNVGGAMLLKLFGRREEEDRHSPRRPPLVRDLGVRISLITRIFRATLMLIPALATALVYGVGGYLVIQGDLTIGTLLALATLLLRLLGPLQGLSNVRIDVMTALVSFERVFEVLDLPTTVPEKPDAVALAAARRDRRVRPRPVPLPAGRRGVAGQPRGRRAHRDQGHRRGPPRHLVHAPSPGQMVALVGPSGAGKTHRSPTSSPACTTSPRGVVRVGGTDVRDLTLQSLEDAVGYVTQDAYMFHDTIRANLVYARPGRRRP